jgi:hypothetical protein
MKKMKTTLLTSVALAACMGTQVFAQKSKESPIMFNLSLDGQASVSTSASVANAGDWSQEPKNYKTTGVKKLTQVDIIKDIGYVLTQNGVLESSFSSKATLELVQGELSGFFNVIPGLSNSVALYDDAGDLDGFFGTPAVPSANAVAHLTTATDDDSTILSDGTVTFVALANGRHYQVNPINGDLPVGHFQPWGQIFIKDPGAKGFSVDTPLCVNVTYFFNLKVHECYDCFYLSSYITDSTFTEKTVSTTGGGPAPCCTGSAFSALEGKGKDQYYLTWSFDDTVHNPYLNAESDNGLYTGVDGIGAPGSGSVVAGLEIYGLGDGTRPDGLAYVDAIKSGLGQPSPFEAQITLNGIVTYSWTLGFVNTTDLLPDFVGTASYNANGYGFVQLVCVLITGTASITEKLAASDTCCLDIPWADSWYGIGWDGDLQDIVWETDAPGTTGTNPTTQENVPLSLTYHEIDWVPNGPDYSIN